ncbi:homocitrate synthase [Pyrococcus abyssi]|uniref:Homocitrate synthase n=1 Tax=Pyrococcus abyssi (strain GE5 / Orsay) TaxID=272844 RepID=HOSA_PYRAB|nr:homocitrate synthase [Pyrococcus abyssi]Q9V1J1.1 RecName: Full=Homocitrate synthase; Short=HCS [Pyrococcus abyssi GE5]CAB49358.1 leuA-2 2-isopropylmalate synthase [Pyrococcus abyssi GE5]CCE69817.1 TPA: trans-homoaconitate synthase [Pyrococcus abyssi GE5]
MVLDSTLREGEQTPGVNYTPEQRLEIAIALDEVGVDFIEIGHPAVSEDVFRGMKLIAEQGLNVELLAHSRALIEDIDYVLKTGVDWVGIFFCLSEACLRKRFRITLDHALEKISRAIEYAKDHGLKVRFTPEDTTRTEWANLKRAIRLAKELKVDRISVADTTGSTHPLRFYTLVKKIVNFGIPVNVHCHNDLGLALANAIMGIEAGATLVDATVNGLGERAGIVDLAQIITVLYYHYGIKKYRLDLLYRVSNLVSEITGISPQPNYPIVGENAFTHKAGLHVSAVLKDPRFYEFLPAEVFGRERTIYVDRYAGKDTIRYYLEKFGIRDHGIVTSLLRKVKSSREPFTWEKLLEEARRVKE